MVRVPGPGARVSGSALGFGIKGFQGYGARVWG